MGRWYAFSVDHMHIVDQRSALDKSDSDWLYFAIKVTDQTYDISNYHIGSGIRSGADIDLSHNARLKAYVQDDDIVLITYLITNQSDTDDPSEQAADAAKAGSTISEFIEGVALLAGEEEAAQVYEGFKDILEAAANIFGWFKSAKCNGPVLQEIMPSISAQVLASHTQNGTVKHVVTNHYDNQPKTDGCGSAPDTFLTYSISNPFSLRQYLPDGVHNLRSVHPPITSLKAYMQL